MESVSAGIGDYRIPAGSVRMIDVAIVRRDGVEQYVREPWFDEPSPNGEVVDFRDFFGLMDQAGFQPSTRWGDSEALEASGERCKCGGALDARSFRREDPLCCRVFAVCGSCRRVAFEY